ncbi:MAG: lytic transglycosylase domain-containing protein [Desulfobulbaceae bacterium]|nr:lytic transglycosylase domain-containing protein [Desulfobulbaceae bacterium]
MLVKAVIKVESDFDHRALSSKGAMGLMQLMPETASDMHVNDPFDPKSNIMGGTRYLGLLLGQFGGDLLLALAAYNAGPTRVVLAQNTIPPFPETIEYVKKVLRHYKRYRTSAVSSGDRWMKAMAY